MNLLLLAALLQAAPVARLPARGLPPVTHPLLLGKAADPASPVGKLGLAAVPAAARLAFVRGLAPQSPAAAALAEQPALLDHVFDNAAVPGLELEGGVGETLGRGEFGVVSAHARIPGAVVKQVHISPGAFLFSLPDPAKVADDEEATARAYAAAGAGPRYLGRDGLVSVRERVYGRTLKDLIRERRFGRKGHRLVLELLDRMAAAGVNSDDLKPENIMLGRTAADPERKAYVVDGGHLLPAKTKEELLAQQTLLLVKWDPAIGEVQFTKPFGRLLEEGLERGRQRTWWARFKQGWKDFWDVPVTPGLR